MEIGLESAAPLLVAAPTFTMLLAALVRVAPLVSRNIKLGRLVLDELPSTSAPDWVMVPLVSNVKVPMPVPEVVPSTPFAKLVPGVQALTTMPPVFALVPTARLVERRLLSSVVDNCKPVPVEAANKIGRDAVEVVSITLLAKPVPVPVPPT